jgi:hypothetical protein
MYDVLELSHVKMKRNFCWIVLCVTTYVEDDLSLIRIMKYNAY